MFTPWTTKTKRFIHDSRVLTTRNLVQALSAGDRQSLFCSTSAVGYYVLRKVAALLRYYSK